MKIFLTLLSALIPLIISGCTDSEASAHVTEPAPENGAQFKKGEGMTLTDKMAESIGLKVGDVGEQKIVGEITLTLRGLPGSNEASGWLTAEQAAKVKVGGKIQLASKPETFGKIQRVEKSASAVLGEFEITAIFDSAVSELKEAAAVIFLEEVAAETAVPRSALLQTAEGDFVYAKNGKCFFRMPVKIGAANNDYVEVTEGLYAGDEVVLTPVRSLWMAELQVLRGGKACNCGH